MIAFSGNPCYEESLASGSIEIPIKRNIGCRIALVEQLPCASVDLIGASLRFRQRMLRLSRKVHSISSAPSLSVTQTHSSSLTRFSARLGRICGLLFCNRCCSYEPQAKLAGFTESNIRLCSYCSSTLLKIPKPSTMATTANQSYLLSSSSTASAQMDPQQHAQSQLSVQDSTLADTSFNSDHFSLSKSPNDRSLGNVDNEQTNNSNAQHLTDTDSTLKSAQPSSSQQRSNNNFNLKTLFNELFRTSQGLQMQKQRHRLRTIECISGREIVDWLLKHQRASVLSEAKLLCQCFVNETYLEPVVLPQTSFVEFKPDQTLYKFGKVKFGASTFLDRCSSVVSSVD